jgi:hypothetical protein
MDYFSAMKAGFEDELLSICRMTKYAGFLRSGRRPFKATTLLHKSIQPPKPKLATMVKLSSEAPKGFLRRHGKSIGLLGLGMLAMDQVQKAKRDWELGRAIRLQQQGS